MKSLSNKKSNNFLEGLPQEILVKVSYTFKKLNQQKKYADDVIFDEKHVFLVKNIPPCIFPFLCFRHYAKSS